jgi:hypothetical protein
MPVRAKFVCAEKSETGLQPCQKTTKLVFSPVVGTTEENKTFWKWTPSGKIEMNVLNPEAANQFEVGKEYYVDFTPVQ